MIGGIHPQKDVSKISASRREWLLDPLVILLLTAITVIFQEQSLGLAYIEGENLARHDAVLNGTAPNPWSYRLLAEYFAEALLILSRALHVPHPVACAFLLLRVLQNALIFSVSLRLYRMLGLTARQSMIGIVLLSYAMTHALNNSDLSFNTYMDVGFYQIAACLVVGRNHLWLLPLSVLASLNRETSLLLSILPIASLIAVGGQGWRQWMPQIRVSAACLLLQVATLLLLRMLIHPPQLAWQAGWGNIQGWPTVWMNLSSVPTLLLMGLTFSVLPILGIWNFRTLPDWLKGLFWVLVPVWFLIHISMVYSNETRIFLVPMALVIIPSALLSRDGSLDRSGTLS